MDGTDERIEIDSGRYIRILETRVSELTIELLRVRAVVEMLTATAVTQEGEYQTDERGELVELEGVNG